MDIDLDSLSTRCGEWLRGTGPEADIVISSRIRLARNLADFPFQSKASDQSRTEVAALLRERLTQSRVNTPLTYLGLEDLDGLDRQMLVERQLISRELSENEGPRGTAFTPGEHVSVMVNEEDHIRMQVLRSGLALDECWSEVDALDDALDDEVIYAFDESLGYLTACPTNVGTGIRVSVMLHLPALVLTKEIQKVFQALQKIGLAVRGLYGEGSQALGDFYQISNQATLGKSEEQIIRNIRDVMPNIIGYERRVRGALVQENRENLYDQISRAHGVLKTAHKISSEETMQLLSSVRMGVNLGLIENLDIPTVNELFIQTQPGHLQKRRGTRLSSDERNVARAKYLRQRLGPSTPS